MTCRINTRRSESGKAFDAVLRTYQDAPIAELLNSEVAPSVEKKGLIGWFESSTREGSAALDIPEVEAGPVRPIVAYVSSANSGKTGKNAGLIPEAFQELLKELLKTP